MVTIPEITLREKCPHSEFFWSVFSCIRNKYLSVFNPNTGKYGPEKLQILTLFTQCNLCLKFEWTKIFRLIPSGNLFSIQEATSWYCRDSQLKLQISRRKKLFIKHNFSKKPKSLSLLSNRNTSDMLFIVMILSFLCYFIYHFSSGKLASLKLLLVSFGLKGYTGKKTRGMT